MENRFLNYLRGHVRIRIRGNSYDRFLNLCAFHGIFLWDLRPCGEAYEANVTVKDFKKLKEIVKKSHASVVIIRRQGLPFFIHKYRKRKFYLVSIACAVFFMFWLSAHIWNITVDGNLSQSDDVIFEYLNTQGICHGMLKSKVDCKELAAEIRNYFSDFAWVAAELQGTRLLIHVKEGVLGNETDTDGKELTPTSLAAAKSGTVVSILVRSGRPLVEAGDTVEKGDLLVSGLLPIYNDSGELSSRQYVASDADVILETQTSYQDVLSLSAVQKQYTGREKIRWLLRIGDTSFALPGTFRDFQQYDILSQLTQLRLSPNFYLPLYIQKYTVKEYEKQKIVYKKEDAEEILRSNFQYFTKNLEEKGVQIFQNDVKIKWDEKTVTASGNLTTREAAVRTIPVEDTEEELLTHEYD